jgi:hypothetical protein
VLCCVCRQTRQFTIYFQKHGGDYVIAFYLNPTPENTSVSVQFEYDVVFDYGTVRRLCLVCVCVCKCVCV